MGEENQFLVKEILGLQKEIKYSYLKKGVFPSFKELKEEELSEYSVEELLEWKDFLLKEKSNAVQEKEEEIVVEKIKSGEEKDVFDELIGEDPKHPKAEKINEEEKTEREIEEEFSESEEEEEKIPEEEVLEAAKLILDYKKIGLEEEECIEELKNSGYNENTINQIMKKAIQLEKQAVKEFEKEKELSEAEEKELEQEAVEGEQEESMEEGNELNESEDAERVEGIDLGEEIDREEVKKEIMEKALNESFKAKPLTLSGVPLTFLEDKKSGSVFIGRKKANYQKYGFEGTLFVGKVQEKEYLNKSVFLDSLNPHVCFVCGARGSGKSYILGVMAEELALKNKNVGIIVVDPIGVFWSMKYPNKEEKEIKLLSEWDLLPQGLKNVKVFIPEGIKNEVPKETFDSTFAIQPSLLTGEDWCLTFGIDRFSPTGLLIDRTLKKISEGFKTVEGQTIKAKGKNYSLSDITFCMENDSDINSREKGFKQDSIRALISRFESAKHWGIFSEKGTPLTELSKENQLTIIDSSFLDDTVTALVLGVLSRRILAARKILTRKEAVQRMKTIEVEKLLELDIPPTWLFIDEAHTLIPSGNIKTPATNSLVEYVKQGRRPGCSLVFATQQPSAIDSRVLSQIDVIVSHKLVFDDDIKAVFKRTPTIIPEKYKKSNFIKTLPVGVGLTGDRSEETSRAFIMKVRPRMSQHEGRDAETSQMSYLVTEEQAKQIIIELVAKKIKREKQAEKKELNKLIESLNEKYNSHVKPEDIYSELVKKGLIVETNSVKVEEKEETGKIIEEEKLIEDKPIEPTEEGFTEQTELLAFPIRINEENALKIIHGIRKKKILGILGEEELIQSIQLKYRNIWKISYEAFNKRKEFITKDAFIDSVNGEFLHFKDGKFVESRGLAKLKELSQEEVKVLRNLEKKKKTLKEISLPTGLQEEEVRKLLDKLTSKNIVEQAVKENTGMLYGLKSEIDIPPHPRTELIESLKELPFVQVNSLAREKENYLREEIPNLLHLLWPNVLVRKVSEVYWPLYHVKLNNNGVEKIVIVDALTGQRIK